MNRKEALEHFETNIAKPAVENILPVFYEKFRQQKEKFCEKLVNAVEQLLVQVNGKEPEVEIATIRISYLQASILDGTYQWQIVAQDKREYLDKKEREFYIAFPEIFTCIEELESELEKEVRKYVGNLYEGDVRSYKIQAFEKCMGCIYQAGMYAFRHFRKNEIFLHRKTHSVFKIMIGGYMDLMQIVFLQSKEDYEKVKEELYKPGEKKHLDEHQMIYRDYSGIELKEVAKRVEAKNLMFACFANSRIRYHIFVLCSMIGVNFSESRIDDSGFVGATMQQADFTGAVLQNCDMHASMFYGGEYVDGQVTPGIFPVSFRNSILHRVNFMCCDLRNCDFEGAKMSEIVLEDAKLQGARIESCYKEMLELTPEQEQEIIWI